MQVQYIVRLIKYIQRSKACINQFRNAFNANISYSIDFETVYLSSQRSNLLKQPNVAIRIINDLCRIFIGAVHVSKVVQFCLYLAIPGSLMCFLTLLSDISAVIFGKKVLAKSKMSPSRSSKDTVNHKLQAIKVP